MLEIVSEGGERREMYSDVAEWETSLKIPAAAMHLTSLQNIEINNSEEYHGWVDNNTFSVLVLQYSSQLQWVKLMDQLK